LEGDAENLLTELLRIYSPSRKEKLLAQHLSNRMRNMGYSRVRMDSAGNVIGQVGRGRLRILLCGHMDTVPGRLPVRARDGRITGRGAADAKSALAAMVVAGSHLRDLRGAIVTVVGATREEDDSLGIQTLIKSRTPFDFAVFGEPSGAARLTVGYRGRIEAHITTRTEGGHASSPWAHTSALDEAFKLNGRLKDYESSRAVPGDRYHSLSLCVTLLSAGSYSNVVPDKCSMTLDIRIPPGLTCANVREEVAAVIASSPGEPRVEFEEGTEPYESDRGSLLLRAFQRAILMKARGKPVLVRKTGTGDMNTFAEARGIPCVTYGPGDSNLSHTEGEFVEIGDYLRSIDVISEAVRQLVQLKGR
jgi:LysW-gamma-L-lysine carboxypeptidase